MRFDPTAIRSAGDAARVVIVGAGPAGAVAAIEAQRRGARVLLIDRRVFPRDKICGGCLGPTGWRVLSELGLDTELERLGARRIERMTLCVPGATVRLPLTAGEGYHAISRLALDAALVRHAQSCGAEFATGVHVLGGSRERDGWLLRARTEQGEVSIAASAVVLASGLAGVAPTSFGLGATTIMADGLLGTARTFAWSCGGPETGHVVMRATSDGYVGTCRMEHGDVTLAAAVRSAAVRRAGLAEAILRILRDAGGNLPPARALEELTGTPLLTRHLRHKAADRLLVAGDAAGYLEPFTGEGMSWAIESGRLAGRAAAAIAAAGAAADATANPRLDSPSIAYDRAWRSNIAIRQRRCRRMAWLLRHPRCLRVSMGVLSRSGRLRRHVTRSFTTAATLIEES